MTRSWVRVPRCLIDSGRLSELPGAAVRAWLLALLQAHTGRFADSLKRDLVTLGMNRRTAERSIASLTSIGAITVAERGGGHARHARYVIGKPHRPFGRFPSDACLCRLLESSGKGPAATYLVLASHADESFQCFPGLKRIAELAGLCAWSVRKALRTLESWGLIVVAPRRMSPGKPTVYRLTPPHAQTGVSGEKHRSWCAQTSVMAHANTGLSVVQEKNLLNKKAEQSVDLDMKGRIERAFESAGVENPERSRLADRFVELENDATLAIDEIVKIHLGGGGPGLVVNKLRELAEVKAHARARRDQQRLRDDALTKGLHEEEDCVRTSNGDLFKRLAAIPRNEWPRFREMALGTMSEYYRKALRGAVPENNLVLAGAMVRLWETERNLPLKAEIERVCATENEAKPCEKPRVDAEFV